ncbi:unnamed protein product [Adineta ricciae]|uniref:Peptidase S1 domain-containing protein n=1 Tax=Adineta ricciae TaxID=249248 RepID=A0A816BXD3_ADIRI|nr:unnamed protein product [Adineta ricciae]
MSHIRMSFAIRLLLAHLLLFSYSIDSTICRWSSVQYGCSFCQPIIRVRIVGGIESIPHSWSWIVSIRLASTNAPFCGGSLVTGRYVLTAAHCFYNDFKKLGSSIVTVLKFRYVFVSGAHYSTERNTYLNSHLQLWATRILLHPQYDTRTKVNDIALVKLS